MQAIHVFAPFGGDDVYVLGALRSPHWAQRLFAFDLDSPGAEYMPWWTGELVQRRFIRVPSSALLWLESRVVGHSATAFHAVTLSLVAVSAVLVYQIAARYVPRWQAVLIAMIPGAHPCTAEVITFVSWQPLATAGLFAVLAALCWIRLRARFSWWRLAAVLLCTALAITSL